MRTLILLGLVIGGAFTAGWFTIEREGDRTRIEINKSEIRSDARQAIDKGREILDKREQERLAREQYGDVNAQQGWPPAATPMPGSGVQGTGYASQPAYPGQTGYGNPPNYASQPGYAQPGYGSQPNYGSQPATGGYNPSYPVPNSGQQTQQPRWSEMPPPWQQQTR